MPRHFTPEEVLWTQWWTLMLVARRKLTQRSRLLRSRRWGRGLQYLGDWEGYIGVFMTHSLSSTSMRLIMISRLGRPVTSLEEGVLSWFMYSTLSTDTWSLLPASTPAVHCQYKCIHDPTLFWQIIHRVLAELPTLILHVDTALEISTDCLWDLSVTSVCEYLPDSSPSAPACPVHPYCGACVQLRRVLPVSSPQLISVAPVPVPVPSPGFQHSLPDPVQVLSPANSCMTIYTIKISLNLSLNMDETAQSSVELGVWSVVSCDISKCMY